MTTEITSTTAKFYINQDGSTTLDSSQPFVLKSQYSQKDVLTIPTSDWVITINNSRYMEIEVTVPSDFKDTHQNGYYTWSIGNYSDIVKIITQPGGSFGKTEYISDNENRDAEVYFRPNY